MHISHLQVKNWRNFRTVDIPLRDRLFIVGPNASGKSNLLDVFRFLRDIAKPEGGGLQKAMKIRGGVSKVRNLSARTEPDIVIKIGLSTGTSVKPEWIYELSIRQQSRGLRVPYVNYEKVYHKSTLIVDRPNEADRKDPDQLTQTYLEQINTNTDFREIVKYFQSITYLHLVPQLLRFSDQIQGRVIEDDPFGQGFLERIAKTSDKTRNSRFKTIENALRFAVPQFHHLKFTRDEATGRPHLQALYTHWRPNAGWQQEDQFSDGTLRLIGLLWSLLEGDALLLLEEPELSLNSGIVTQLAPIIYMIQKIKKRQVLISTHSEALLTERGIDGREVLMLTPVAEGTTVKIAADINDVRTLLKTGLTVGEVIMHRIKPGQIQINF